MKKLRTAVVGLGRIGWGYHIPNIIKHEGFELVAVTDPMTERLEEAKENFSVKGYTEFNKLLEEEKPDLIVIVHLHLSCHSSNCSYGTGVDVFLENQWHNPLRKQGSLWSALENWKKTNGLSASQSYLETQQ